MTKTKKGIFLALSTAIISGFSIFINSFFVAKVPATEFAFLKNMLVGVAILFVIIGISIARKKTAEIFSMSVIQWLQLVFVGLIGGSIPFIMFFNGLSEIGAAQGSVIHKTMFVFVLIMAGLFLKEKNNKFIPLIAGLIIIGNYLALNVRLNSLENGHIMVLGATFLWAIENVYSKYLLKNISGNTLAFGRMFFGAAFIFMYIFLTGETGTLTSLNIDQWILVIISSILLLAYVLTWYNSLKHIKVSLATMILLLGSPITTLLDFVFLKKTISPMQIFGSLMIAASIISLIYIDMAKKTETINLGYQE